MEKRPCHFGARLSKGVRPRDEAQAVRPRRSGVHGSYGFCPLFFWLGPDKIDLLQH
ncbi:hypothetical protein V6Z12_A05G211500 [Gossypium hirsutum]